MSRLFYLIAGIRLPLLLVMRTAHVTIDVFSPYRVIGRAFEPRQLKSQATCQPYADV